MRRGSALFAFASLMILCCGLLACGGSSPEEQAAAKADEEWAWIEQAKADLDAKRQELAQFREQPESEQPESEPSTEASGDGEGEGEGEGETPPTPEELAAQADAMQEEIYKLAEKFGARLAQFINDQAISVGAELTEVQNQGLAYMSDEAIVMAQEYIDKGGEYKKAIQIFTDSLRSNPGYEPLLEAKARAEENQYMSQERFAQVKKKMTQDEVRALLGQVKRSNLQEYTEQNRVGWFYKKQNGGAAGVFFKEKSSGSGDWTVETLNYEAIKPRVIESDGSEATDEG